MLRHRVVNRFNPKERSDDVVVELVRRALETWGAKKHLRFRPDLGPHLSEIGEHAFASFQKVRFGSQTAVRWRLREGVAPHFYRSTVTLLIEDDRTRPSWVWYDVETDREISYFSPPGLTTYLNDALGMEPRDRVGQFSEGMRVLQAGKLGDFLDVILEADERQLPAVVSATRGWRVGEEERIEDALASLSGLATFWVLPSDGVDEFNDELVSRGYRVLPGSLHMFQSDLDTGDELDSRRHRWWAAHEVRAKPSKELAGLLYSEAMKTALKLPLPEPLVGLGDRIDSAAAESMLQRLGALAGTSVTQVAARTQEPEAAIGKSDAGREALPAAEKPVVGDGESSRRRSRREGSYDTEELALMHDLSEVTSLLGIDPAQETSGLLGKLRYVVSAMLTWLKQPRTAAVSVELVEDLSAQLGDLRDQRSQVEVDRDEYRDLLATSEAETAEAREELDAQKSKGLEIRRQQQEAAAKAEYFESLYKQALHESKSGAEPTAWARSDPSETRSNTSEVPESIEILLEWIDRLDHVERCPELDVRSASSVRDSRQRDRILRDVWRYALELEAYATSPSAGDGGGLVQYVRAHSATITSDQFARDETSDVKSARKGKLARMRTFSVPEVVDPSGSAFFGAHFRLTQDSGKAMRMHIYDATAKNGKVYIGYIGQHHRSRGTN